jgi:cyclopropane-fatty-acyl-phospholipid synthase
MSDMRSVTFDYWIGKVNAEHRHADEPWFERYAQELAALMPHGGTLFDVGCGSCQITTYLAPAYDRIVAFDFSESMLAAARTRIAERGITNMTVLTGEAVRFPESEATANAILANGVVQYLDEAAMRRHLAECARVLAPGGVVCWGMVPNRYLRWKWYSGQLANPRPPLTERVKRRWYRSKDFMRARGAHLWDGIGYWFTQEEMRRVCESAGFDVEFRNSWYYEYRFTALLRRR